MEKLKVLVSAYAFYPNKPSRIEYRAGYTGWKLVEQLVPFCDVWVITTSRNRDPVLESLSDGALPEAKIHFVNLPKLPRILRKSFSGQYLSYYLWQRRALEEARALHSANHFDAVHHLTLGPEWFPSLVGSSLPIPFLWGPLWEDEAIPKSLSRFGPKILNLKKSWEQTFQGWARRRHVRRKCAQNARAILISDPESLERFPRIERKKIHFFPSYGLDSVSDGTKIKSNLKEKTFRVISAGNLTRESGFIEIIQAFHRFVRKHPDADFAIYGKGPDKNHLKRQIHSMDRQARIRIHSRVERDPMQEVLRKSDVFVCPILSRDEGAWVIEAMAAGLPVIGMDFGGQGMHIQDKWGIKVRPGSPDQIVEGLVLALENLYANQSLRLKMARTSLKNAKDNYVWSQIGKKLKKIYGEALLQDEDIRYSRRGEERFFY
ncbi:glycosyltransferase family 4 protein [Acidobacteriota bacterium]